MLIIDDSCFSFFRVFCFENIFGIILGSQRCNSRFWGTLWHIKVAKPAPQGEDTQYTVIELTSIEKE